MRRQGGAPAGHDVNAYLARCVPITQAMGIRFRSFDERGVVLTAPLKPNVNDKGIAFGGTLASILALSGWALADLLLRREGEVAEVLIAAATIEYLAPVAGRIVARCPLPPPREVAAFLSAYRLRGRAHLHVEAAVETPAGAAVRFHATYVARRPPAARQYSVPERRANTKRPDSPFPKGGMRGPGRRVSGPRHPPATG